MKRRISLSLLVMATIFWLISCKSLSHGNDIKVLSIKKVVDKTLPSHEMCESFGLTNKNIETYFSIAKEVSGHELHHESIILPCKFKGSIRIRGENLQWEIFAGGLAIYITKNPLIKDLFVEMSVVILCLTYVECLRLAVTF